MGVVRGVTLRGVDAVPVEVEVEITGGLFVISVVGLPDAAVREARPDVVLIHEGHYALASAPDWRRVLPGTPRVLYVHNPVSRSYGRQELRRLLAALDGMVFVSEDARRRLGERARGLPPSVVVNNGVDDRVFHPRGRMGEGAGRLRITFAGQVSDY